jgi:hypothetical protein
MYRTRKHTKNNVAKSKTPKNRSKKQLAPPNQSPFLSIIAVMLDFFPGVAK